MRRPDERDQVARLCCDLVERPLGCADEARPEEEILGRIAGDRELGEEDDVGAEPARLLEVRHDLVPVSRQVADDRVDLRERQPHASSLPVFDFEAKTGNGLCSSRGDGR